MAPVDRSTVFGPAARPQNRGVPGLGGLPKCLYRRHGFAADWLLMLVIDIQRLRPAPWERAAATIGAGVAAMVAVIVQTVWLSDPKARPNWTLPQPGHFDAAGWWHTVYFTVMSIVLLLAWQCSFCHAFAMDAASVTRL